MRRGLGGVRALRPGTAPISPASLAWQRFWEGRAVMADPRSPTRSMHSSRRLWWAGGRDKYYFSWRFPIPLRRERWKFCHLSRLSGSGQAAAATAAAVVAAAAADCRRLIGDHFSSGEEGRRSGVALVFSSSCQHQYRHQRLSIEVCSRHHTVGVLRRRVCSVCHITYQLVGFLFHCAGQEGVKLCLAGEPECRFVGAQAAHERGELVRDAVRRWQPSHPG